MCHYDRDEKGKREKTYFCYCGATLITSLHALTSFWCIHDYDNQLSGCEKTDFSNGEEDWLIAQDKVLPNTANSFSKTFKIQSGHRVVKMVLNT